MTTTTANRLVVTAIVTAAVLSMANWLGAHPGMALVAGVAAVGAAIVIGATALSLASIKGEGR